MSLQSGRTFTSDFARLAERTGGPVLLPGDPRFSAELAGFNLSVDHDPAVIVGARGVEDVVAAVDFARVVGLPVGVQATGHGAVISNDGVLITTRRMREVIIDSVARTALVAAGVRWREVISAASGVGLAPLNGSYPLVGVVGYTLGGGLGALGRMHGYAADHVLQMQLVPADGQPLEVSPDQHPDLYWGVLGGKDNFGIVTSMKFELFPVARFFGGGMYFRGSDASAVVHGWRRWLNAVPEEMATSLAFLRLPDAPSVPEFLRGRFIVHLRVSYFGSSAEGAAMVGPLRSLAPLLLDTVAERPYSEIASVHEDGTEPVPYTESNIMMRTLTENAADALLDVAGPQSGCEDMVVELRHLGAALSHQGAVPNAVGNRDARFSLSVLSAAGSEATNTVLDGMAAWGTGGRYLNFLGGVTSASTTSSAYDTVTLERLRILKDRYDPENLFRLNHNILPHGRAGRPSGTTAS